MRPPAAAAWTCRSRIAAHQDRRSRYQPAAERAVEFGKAGLAPLRQLDRLIERDERDQPPPLDRSCLAENTVSGASSTSVFHSPQSAHCPCQRGETLPQDWQT
jgi:hypothetical protein